MTYFRDNMAPILNWWPVKVIVVVVFACYVAGACYGITRIEEGLERRKLSRADSYSVEFYDREDFYFREFPYRIQVKVRPHRTRSAAADCCLCPLRNVTF